MKTLHQAFEYANPLQRDVAAFHDAFLTPNRLDSPGPLPADRVELRLGLIREEGIEELREAIDARNDIDIVDALIDTMYVSFGALVEMGFDAGSPAPALEWRSTGEMLIDTAERAAEPIQSNYLQLAEVLRSRNNMVRAINLLSEIICEASDALTDAGIDPVPFFAEVQRANMSKLGADGRPIFSRGMQLDGYPEGKVLKGPGYSPPNLARIWAELYR